MAETRIIPLGGADEVGASCSYVEIGETRLVVDAGIRIGVPADRQLPDLGRIQEECGGLDAIILTHAHMDHSGALPLLHAYYQGVPIFATAPTIALVRILLSDALKIMGERSEREGEIPLYPPEGVEACLGAMLPLPFGVPASIADGAVRICFHPAGHILGAATASIEGEAGSILFTGDVSITNQLTVPGMIAPPVKLDVVVAESTYGARMHSDRGAQEQRLAGTVAAVVERGGKVLIPAFALGRAQEVILILTSAMRLKRIPEFPIFVDGMVRSINTVYRDFPDFLQPRLRKIISRGRNPFYPEDGSVEPVTSPAKRKEILDGPPCCVIASSGMLTGGASAAYAPAIAGDAKNLIAITGYQDEESPGRKLLALADGAGRENKLRIGGEIVDVLCDVRKYGLSAHADSGELAGLLARVEPSSAAVLVHGDGESREGFATQLGMSLTCDIRLPANGEELRFRTGAGTGRRRRGSGGRVAGIGKGRELSAELLPELHRTLWVEVGRRGLFRTSDIFARWHGPEIVPDQAALDSIAGILDSSMHLFSRDRKRPFMFRLLSPDEAEIEEEIRKARDPVRGGKLEVNDALAKVSASFDGEKELYRKGAHPEEGLLKLFFHFPAVARKKFGERFVELEQATGWKVELNEMPHQGALTAWIRARLPGGWTLAREPALLHDRNMLRIRVSFEGKADRPEDETVLKAEFLEATGTGLEVERAGRGAVHAGAGRNASGKMEINAAFGVIDMAFEGRPHKPHKKSLKTGRIILKFISPAVGDRYEELIAGLSSDTGYELSVNRQYDQFRIISEIRNLVPEEWGLEKEPSFHPGEEPVVRVKLRVNPPPSSWSEVVKQALEITGVKLDSG